MRNVTRANIEKYPQSSSINYRVVRSRSFTYVQTRLWRSRAHECWNSLMNAWTPAKQRRKGISIRRGYLKFREVALAKSPALHSGLPPALSFLPTQSRLTSGNFRATRRDREQATRMYTRIRDKSGETRPDPEEEMQSQAREASFAIQAREGSHRLQTCKKFVTENWIVRCWPPRRLFEFWLCIACGVLFWLVSVLGEYSSRCLCYDSARTRRRSALGDETRANYGNSVVPFASLAHPRSSPGITWGEKNRNRRTERYTENDVK